MQALPAALVFACLLLPIRATESKVPRWEGAILLAAYVAFAAWQVTSPAK
jgi:Ca2+/Na+ antiporter